MDIRYKDIDRAEMPPGFGSFDRPWYWYTHASFVLSGEECAASGCECRAHAGLILMKEDDKVRWQEKQFTEEMMAADIVFYCAPHFTPAIERLTQSPT